MTAIATTLPGSLLGHSAPPARSLYRLSIDKYEAILP